MELQLWLVLFVITVCILIALGALIQSLRLLRKLEKGEDE